MKYYIKNSLKVLTDYFISMIIFVVLLYPFMGIMGSPEKISRWLPVYSIIFFLFLYSMLYSDYKRLAETEKKPQNELNPHPLKGLIFGFIGFSPVILIELIYPLIVFGDQFLDRLKHVALNTLMGPLYFVIRMAGGTAFAYIIASIIVPVIVMVAYMAGYYGWGRKKKSSIKTTPTQTKSPWNPSVKK